MRVALMVTCLNDALFPDAGKAVVTLLRRLGVDVEFPEAQTCCAQPMVNTGYLDEAVPVVRRRRARAPGPPGTSTRSSPAARVTRASRRPSSRSARGCWS
jgi:hypothetical protein